MSKEYGIVHIHVKDMPSYAYVLHEVACLHTPYFHTSLTGKSCEALTLYPQDFPITIRNVQEGDAIVLRLGRKRCIVGLLIAKFLLGKENVGRLLSTHRKCDFSTANRL